MTSQIENIIKEFNRTHKAAIEIAQQAQSIAKSISSYVADYEYLLKNVISSYEKDIRSIANQAIDIHTNLKEQFSYFDRCIKDAHQGFYHSDLYNNYKSIENIIEQIRINYPHSDLYRNINSLQDSIKNIELHLKRDFPYNKISNIVELACKISVQSRAVANISIQPDGTLCADGNVFEQRVLNEKITDYIDNSGIFDDSTPLWLRLNKYLNAAHKEHPFISGILLHLILSIILILAAIPFKNIEYNKCFQHNKKAIITLIRSELENAGKSASEIRNTGFVIANELNVRSKASRKSNILGYIYFGNIVTIIERKKHWIKIEYVDEGGMIVGWVFARYIEKVDSKRKQ
jgi:hypothetical protein